MLLGHADYKTTANIYSHVLRQTKNNQILKYNQYITNTIQKSLDSIMNITEETINNPELRQKAIDTMKKNVALLIESKFDEREKELKEKKKQEKSNQEIKQKDDAKKVYSGKRIIRRKIA